MGDAFEKQCSGSTSDPSRTPRRQFLSGIGALAAGMFIANGNRAAQAPVPSPRWIDVHTHFSTPNWVKVFEAKARQGLFNADNALPSARAWTSTKLIESMDQAGVAVSILSMTWPGIWFGENQDSPDAVRHLARECNDSVAKVISDYPGRVGLFAVLPIPDMESSLREIEYAFDTLKADGVGLLTSYGNKWLGDPTFAPLFEELNRRKAVVYTHPQLGQFYGPTDTTRTIASLLKDGTSSRYPNIHFIFSHGGGFMPYRIENFIGRDNVPQRLAGPAAPNTALFELRRFYYDTAQVANPVAIAALKQVVTVSQILFGTDYNYRADLTASVKELQECGQLNSEELRLVGRENALKLLPKYKT